VDSNHIVVATLDALAREGTITASVVQKAIKDLGINPDKPNPATA
jgi:pyruvate dehydrogenase E1 component